MKKILIKNYIYYKLYPLILFHFVSLILIFFFNLVTSLVLCHFITYLEFWTIELFVQIAETLQIDRVASNH